MAAPDPLPADALLTVKQAAERLGLTSSALYSAIAAGELRHFRFGTGQKRRHLIRISAADLEAYKQACCVQPAPVEVERPRNLGLKIGGFQRLRAAGFVPPKGKLAEVGGG